MLTERDREIIRNEPNNPRHPEIKSRIRTRIDRLEEDLEILEKNESELADRLREEICKGSEENAILEVVKNIEEKLDEIQNER